MGRKKVSILKVKGYSIYPFLLPIGKADKEGYRGVNIRITDRTRSIDIECYDVDGIRIKTKTGKFENGKLTNGYAPEIVDKFNVAIANLQTRIVEYVDKNSHLNKELLLAYLYGSDYKSKQKKQNTYVTIPVSYQGKIIDSYTLESKTIEKLVDENIENLTYTNTNGEQKTIEGFFDAETGENLIESEDDYFEVIDQLKTREERNEALRKLELEKSQMNSEQLYKNGYYDKNNIFDLFGLCWYPNSKGKEITNSTWAGGTVIRLLQYKENANPSSNIKEFNKEWCYNFLNYLFNTGYVSLNSKIIEPLRYNPDLFKRAPIPYENNTKIKYLKMFKGVVKALVRENILPAVDLSGIKLTDFITRKEAQNIDETPRDEMMLTKKEIDYLFYYDLKNKELTRVKHIWLLQIMFGGLRINEYRPDNLKIRDDGHGGKMVAYKSSHQEKVREIHNPLNEYADSILKLYNYEIPFYEGEKPGLHENETDYNSKLKIIAERVGFNRLVKGKIRIDKKWVKGEYPIMILISSLWARKSFAEMLENLGLSREELKWFTGHTAKREVIDHYLKKKFKDVVRKKDLIEMYNVKPEKPEKF